MLTGVLLTVIMFRRDNMPNMVFRVPEGLLFGCMEFGWVVGSVGS